MHIWYVHALHAKKLKKKKNENMQLLVVGYAEVYQHEIHKHSLAIRQNGSRMVCENRNEMFRRRLGASATEKKNIL